MSVLIGQHTSNTKLHYQGFSDEVENDTMPILEEKNNGSIFEVLDTNDVYVWHIDNWYLKGGGLGLGTKLFTMTGGVTLQNSAIETSMLDGGVGSKMIPANSLKAGDVINFYWFSRLTCGTSQQSTIRLKLGGNILKESLATLPNNLTENMFEGDIKVVVLSTGEAGLCRISGSSEVTQNNLTGLKRDLGSSQTFVIDTTTDLEFDFTYQWSTAAVTNVHTSYAANIIKN